MNNNYAFMQIALAYSESIEKLRAVLSTMQSMSQKRESLEKKLRSQLEGEIRRLKQETVSEVENDTESNIAENLIQNASLEADVVKVKFQAIWMVMGWVVMLNESPLPYFT